ncbi:MAG: hypothetical protein CMB08_04300 [Euryarchaeota archaeon]|nr:hypothetical protein [Euryarchaeota archaeon]
MNETLFVKDRDILMMKLSGRHVDTDTLLSVTPKEIAEALLIRRKALKEQLPNIIKNLDNESEALTPKLIKIKEKNEKINKKISEIKKQRDAYQKEAGEIWKKIKDIQIALTESGNMINLDPKWKKERMMEELEEIEFNIQTVALDHKAEKKMIDARRNIIRQNELWLKERKSSNPQMAEFIEKRKKMNSLYKAADKEHKEMIKNVNLGEPIHAKYMARKTELLDIERQRDRARQLLKNLDRDISYWENTILDGFDELMTLAMKVQQGGMSSFTSNKNKKGKNNINSKKVEEEE